MDNALSSNVRHCRDLLSSVNRLMNQKDENLLKDLNLICKDGIVRWSRFLLAANSHFLRQVLDFDDDNSSIVLPDVTSTTVSSMLKCTVNMTVRSDTLSVNELEVMRLLRFSLLSNKTIEREPDDSIQMDSIENEMQTEEQEIEEIVPTCQEEHIQIVPAIPSTSAAIGKEPKIERRKDRRTFVCEAPDCGLTFERKQHLERHFASHSKQDKEICDICGKVFHHADNLKLHLLYHRDVLKIQTCPHCKESLSGRRALKLHIETKHLAKVDCKYCDKKMTKRLLKRHLARRHKDEMSESDESYSCQICKREFHSAQALAVHHRTHQGINGFIQLRTVEEKVSPKSSPKDYVTCGTCNKLFATGAHLATHKRRCHLKEHSTCHECGKIVKDLRQHKRQVHERVAVVLQSALASRTENVIPEPSVPPPNPSKRKVDPSKNETCQVCGKIYNDNHGLNRHLREVHAENRYECPLCGHFFPVRHSLERHIRNVHHPVKHECPFCGIAVIHLAVHIHSAHGLEPDKAKDIAESRIGQSSARTDLTLDWVLQRRQHQQQLLNKS